MHFLTIISCLYMLKFYIKNTERAGFDERLIFFPNVITPTENVTREQIMKIQEKREMLDFFESNDIKIEDKLYEIGGRGVPSGFNILKGGLLSDWNFKFDDEFHTNPLNFYDL